MNIRSTLSAAVAALVLAAVAFAADTRKGHPHFSDGGALSWSTALADAQAAAKASDKLIFIEMGREK